MTIVNLMANMEKEEGRRSLESSSSNGGRYVNDYDDYDDDNTEVLVTYKVSSAAKAIQSKQALGANVLIVDLPLHGSMTQRNL